MQETKTKDQNNNQREAVTGDPLASCIVEAMRGIKATEVTCIDMGGLESAPASCFIICQGKSTTQVGAIADNIEKEVRGHLGLRPDATDGMRNASWVILDYGRVMAHVFLPETRALYNLEELWGDADITRLPDMD